MDLPNLPAPVEDFIPYCTGASGRDCSRLQPYLDYEARLRQIYAQEPDNPLLQEHHVNTVPVYAGHADAVKIRARDLEAESQAVRENYLLPLPDKDRRADGSPAVVPTKRDFETNFDIFTEASLRYLDWNNVVAAGSSVVTSLLPVDHPHGESRRAQREYYNQKLAPASDIDLFIYGLDEESGLKKLKQIESNIRDGILCETTMVRTKYAVTIVSQYPIRHIQIVLRLYKSISEILTGFDVDCACVAYDGSQVWVTPRTIVAFMTQVNTIDLSRRSPSYENRLSKYSHRGFEVYWPLLDRSRIDPTIFERSFGSVVGLARLLVFEALPTPEDRDKYRDQRRRERGRPEAPYNPRNREYQLPGNIKDDQPDEVPDWIDEEEVSNYHTFTLPYGPRYNAKRIERLLFTKDMLLNAEWNRPDDREVNLHRHPAFIGDMKDVLEDCCGFCPTPTTKEEIKLAEEESRIYISGNVRFIKDNPGRQEIGSFCPLSADGWTEMAYVANSQRLSQAIVDGDLALVEQWCQQPDVDINGRDHTGRTPLHLAAMCSTPEIVQFLLDNGAQIIARIADGLTAFHIAVRRGNVPIVQAMIERSLKNAAEENERKNAQSGGQKQGSVEDDARDSSGEVMVDEQASQNSHDGSDTLTQGSFVKISEVPDTAQPSEEDGDSQGPDIIDPNLQAWDYLTTPLHLAIMGGHVEIVRLLVHKLDADTLLPVVRRKSFDGEIFHTILTLVLATRYPPNPTQMIRELHDLGVPLPFSQVDPDENTVVHHIVNDENIDMVQYFHSIDPQDVKRALCHLYIERAFYSRQPMSSLTTSIRLCNSEMALKLLELGSPANISFDVYRRAHHRFVRTGIKMFGRKNGEDKSTEELRKDWATKHEQPVIEAILNDLPQVAQKLLDIGADVNEVTGFGKVLPGDYYFASGLRERKSVLDLVRSRIDDLRWTITIYPEELENFRDFDKPARLDEDDTYLHGFKPGSYQFFVAQSNLQVAKISHAAMWEKFEEVQSSGQRLEENREGTIQKKEAMESTLESFQEVERFLLARNAKTYGELYPERLDPSGPPERTSTTPKALEKDAPLYQTEFYFKGTDPDETVQRGYVLLFEAAWEGDAETVKALTLSKWDLGEDNKLSQDTGASAKKREPLEIAVEDRGAYNPFAVAASRGHFELARLVMEIAAAQYLPPSGEKRRHYSLAHSGSADSDDSDDSDESVGDNDSSGGIRVASRQVVEGPVTSTVEELEGLANRVASKVSPLDLFNWEIQVWRLCDSFEEAEQKGIRIPDKPYYCDPYPGKVFSKEHFADLLRHNCDGDTDLTDYAVLRNDGSLFSFLVQLGQELVSCEREREGKVKSWRLPHYSFTRAAQHGRIQMMEQVIEATARELPLLRLAQKHGVWEDVVEKPKYYRGLSVRGRKRKDWLAADRDLSDDGDMDSDNSNLLEILVRYTCNMDTLKWCLSGTPLRSYMVYIERHQDDKMIQALQKRPGGIRPVIEKWLRESPRRAVHAAVENDGKEGDVYPILEHLLALMPKTINSVNGSAGPLLYHACERPNLKLIKLIVDKGADCFKRGPQAMNILHQVLTNTGTGDEYIPWWNLEHIRKFLNMFESSVIEQLLRQRNSVDAGSETPLLAFMRRRPRENVEEIIHLILSYSQGRDLETMDASGEYPLHYAVREDFTNIARILLEYRPSLLYFENAVGITPLELINNSYLRKQLQPGCWPRTSNRIYGSDNIPDHSRALTVPDRREELFIPEEVLRERSEKSDSTENTWRLCQEVARAHPQKRKLVSLLDANEIVKRLCSRTEQRNAEGTKSAVSDLDSDSFLSCR